MSNFDDFFAESGGGNFLPIVKYDAKAGRMARVDGRGEDRANIDITRNFKAIFDLANIEVGYIKFVAGQAPDFRVSRFADGKSVTDPGEGFKRGVRMVVKLSKDCGGDVRELASNAKAFTKAIKKLMAEYNAGAANNPDKLPVVAMTDSLAETSGEGQKRTTNYVPVFEITAWVKRPEDLVYEPRNSSSSPSSFSSDDFGAPPSTGSTKVSAPADEDDFG